MIRNVTFLTGEYPPMQGGIADHTAYLAQHLAGLGVNSTILTSRRWAETTTGSSPRHQPGAPDVHPVLPRWDWRCWRAVARYLARQQPDVLHIQYQAAAFNLGGWINLLPWYLRRRKKKDGHHYHLSRPARTLRFPQSRPAAVQNYSGAGPLQRCRHLYQPRGFGPPVGLKKSDARQNHPARHVAHHPDSAGQQC